AYEAPTGIKTVQFTQTEDGSFAGILADASSSRFLSLVKAGPARLTLGGANTYTGPTVVTNGHLRINGSLAAGTTTVASPGTLSGTGTLAVPVVVNGTLAPGGDGPGRLTISNTLTLAATANTTMALAKSGGTFSNSAVAGTTSIAAGGTLTVTASGDALAAGDSFTLFNRTPGGTFAATNLPTLASGLRWQTTDNFQTLSVVLNQQSQTIAAFTPIPGMTYAPGATVGVVTPAASSGLPVAVSVKSGPATLSGNTLTVTGAGLVVLAANQAGNGTYGPAAEVTTSFLVAKAAAMVTLGMLGQTYDGSGRAATAATTPAGLPVVFSYSSTNYPASSLPPTNAGSYAVTGTVDHANYTGSKSGTLVVARASATVTLGSLAQAYDGTPRPATATTTPSGLAVRFTYYVGLSATGAGTTNAPTAIGTYTVVGAVTDTNYQGSGSGTLQITSAPVPAPSVLGDRVPRLRLIGPFADGGVTLEFAASSRQTYRVEASSDLVDWIPVPFQLAPGGASSEWLRSHSPDADRILRVLPRSMGDASGRGLFYRVVGQPGSDR
ncbi:MAG: MBG domain-containing protein, partial [Verrucomicrobiota bacterium]